MLAAGPEHEAGDGTPLRSAICSLAPASSERHPRFHMHFTPTSGSGSLRTLSDYRSRPWKSVAETMRAGVGVRSSLRRSFKDKLGWKPAIILSRKDWHCVQDRAVVSWPRPGTEVRLDPAPPASSPLRGFGGDGGNRRRQPNGGSREIDRHPIVAPVSGFTARRPCP